MRSPRLKRFQRGERNGFVVGEFISSFDQWMTPDKQRQIARHLEEVTSELTPEVKNNKRPLGPLQHLDYFMADDFLETTDDDFPMSDFPL